MFPMPNFVKGAFPYGLLTYLLIDGYAAPQINQHQALAALKQRVGINQTVQLPADSYQMVSLLDIDKPMPTNLSGFNHKSEQGIGSFVEKILTSGPNLNISGGLNYGYNYYHKGHHAKWH